LNTTPFLLQSSLCSILYPRVSQTYTHTVRRHLCHARRIYLKVKRSFTQRKWGRLRCPVPSSPSQRQRQHQRMRTGRRWLAEVQTPHRPAAPGRLVRSSDGDVNRFTPHRPAALRVVFLTDRRGTSSRWVLLHFHRFHSSMDSGARESLAVDSGVVGSSRKGSRVAGLHRSTESTKSESSRAKSAEQQEHGDQEQQEQQEQRTRAAARKGVTYGQHRPGALPEASV